MERCVEEHHPGEDPGFPAEGNADPSGCANLRYDFAKFSQKNHKIQKILGSGGARPRDVPL